MVRQFSVSMDVTMRIMTIVLIVLMSVVSCLLIYHAFSGEELNVWSRTVLVLVGAFSVVLLPVLAFFAPRAYIVTPSHVVVHRLGPDVKVPRDRIRHVQPIPGRLRAPLRLWGAAGFLGAWGWYYNRDLGVFRAYVTRKDQTVILRLTESKPLVLSPDDPEGFLEALAEAPSPSS